MGRFRALHALCHGDDSGDNRRRAGRILTEPVGCSGGDLLDLSSTGARFESRQKWAEGETREITLGYSDDGAGLTVKARCVWVKKSGMFKRMVGVEFEGLGEDERASLSRLATRSAKRAWGAMRQSNDVNWDQLEREAEKTGSSEEAA